MQNGISFSEAWNLYRASGMSNDLAYVSIGYRKLDGTFGRKEKVRRASGKSLNNSDNHFKERKDVNGIQNEVRRGGEMHFVTQEGHRFKIYAFGLMEINGRKVDPRF